ncbi:hypothetical protein BGZ72_005617 [Mortierella alpina]|nr:hypothetical protein BGZ72_005617 [Mortierella alpina]
MNWDAYISINLESASNAGTYQLHYIEMDYCNKETDGRSHCVPFFSDVKSAWNFYSMATGSPNCLSKLGAMLLNRLRKLSPFTLIQSRDLVCTLQLCASMLGKQAIVEIWDIAVTDKAPSPGVPQHLSVPSAWGSVPAPDVPKPENTAICISCSGSTVTFFTDGSEDPHISFQLLTWTLQGAYNDEEDTKPRTLSSDRPCNSLLGFVGFGAFVTATDDAQENRRERYIVCDGVTVSVYSTSGDWSLLYTITLCLERNLTAARNVVRSGRGRYFAWTGDKGVVSVWDMESAKHFVHIPLDDAIAEGSPVKFSTDGSFVAICFGILGLVAVHQLPSGVKLGPLKTFSVNRGYRLEAHQRSRMVYSFPNGSVVDIIKLEVEDSGPSHTPELKQQTLEEVKVFRLGATQMCSKSQTGNLYNASLEGKQIKVKISFVGVSRSVILYLPLGVEKSNPVSVVFLPKQCRLIVVADYWCVWDLPQSARSKEVTLVQIWALRGADTPNFKWVDNAMTDDQENQVTLRLSPYTPNGPDPSSSQVAVMTYPMSEHDTLPISEQYRISQGISGAVMMYNGNTSTDKEQDKAIDGYLSTLIRPSSMNPTSCVVTICRLWNGDDSSKFKAIIDRLLRPIMDTSLRAVFHWIPELPLTKSSDPVAILMGKAEAHPEALEAAKKVIDYFKLRFKSHVHVECYAYNLEFYDNPAIAALVAYKWYA